MSRRTTGLTLLYAGGLIAVVGLIGMVASGNEPNDETNTSTTGVASTLMTTTTSLAATTTVPVATTSTTTVPTTTTTNLDAVAEVETFVPDFAEAIARGDIEFLLDTLHPSVLASFGEELCRSFIEDEILLLENYRLTGEITGPTAKTIAGISVESYEGPVSFDFQGGNFEAVAQFAVEDRVRWFTECR